MCGGGFDLGVGTGTEGTSRTVRRLSKLRIFVKRKTVSTATTGTIKSNGTATTTEGSITSIPVSPPTCTDPNAIEEESTGTITGGTGVAAKSIKKGWTFQIFICADLTTGVLSLAPGTTFQIGKGLWSDGVE